MNVFPILLFPDEALRKKAKAVQDVDGSLSHFIARLTLTMQKQKGCVGIAAPQVGDGRRIIVTDVSSHRKATEKHGLVVMINPEMLGGHGSVVTREGCLSVPDFTGNVERKSVIAVRYTSPESRECILETSGFEAVVIQHEFDHLDGILFLDRIANLKRDLFRRKTY